MREIREVSWGSMSRNVSISYDNKTSYHAIWGEGLSEDLGNIRGFERVLEDSLSGNIRGFGKGEYQRIWKVGVSGDLGSGNIRGYGEDEYRLNEFKKSGVG